MSKIPQTQVSTLVACHIYTFLNAFIMSCLGYLPCSHVAYDYFCTVNIKKSFEETKFLYFYCSTATTVILEQSKSLDIYLLVY